MDLQNLPSIQIPAGVSQGDSDEKGRKDSKISPAPAGRGEVLVPRYEQDWAATWEDVRSHWLGLDALCLSQGA